MFTSIQEWQNKESIYTFKKYKTPRANKLINYIQSFVDMTVLGIRKL